jgi:hypothetical protein
MVRVPAEHQSLLIIQPLDDACCFDRGPHHQRLGGRRIRERRTVQFRFTRAAHTYHATASAPPKESNARETVNRPAPDGKTQAARPLRSRSSSARDTGTFPTAEGCTIACRAFRILNGLDQQAQVRQGRYRDLSRDLPPSSWTDSAWSLTAFRLVSRHEPSVPARCVSLLVSFRLPIGDRYLKIERILPRRGTPRSRAILVRSPLMA